MMWRRCQGEAFGRDEASSPVEESFPLMNLREEKCSLLEVLVMVTMTAKSENYASGSVLTDSSYHPR